VSVCVCVPGGVGGGVLLRLMELSRCGCGCGGGGGVCVRVWGCGGGGLRVGGGRCGLGATVDVRVVVGVWWWAVLMHLIKGIQQF